MAQNLPFNLKGIVILLKGFLIMKKIVYFFALFCAGVANAGVISATQGYSVYTTNGGGNSITTSDRYAGDTGSLTSESSRIYELFDLSGLSGSSVSSAVFSIEVSSEFANAAGSLGLYSVFDDSWTTTTSWQDKASLGDLLYSFNPETFLQTLSFDVTSFVNSEFLGDGLASFAIAGITEYGQDNSWHYFTQNTSKLDVIVSEVPEPSPLALLALGLAGIGYMRKKKV